MMIVVYVVVVITIIQNSDHLNTVGTIALTGERSIIKAANFDPIFIYRTKFYDNVLERLVTHKSILEKHVF